MYELLAGLILSLTAAVVGAWGVSRRDRPLHGPLDDGSLGLPRLQRWDVSYRPRRMQRLRSRAPRLEVSRFVVFLILAALLAGGGAFAYSRWWDRSTLGENDIASQVAAVDQRRREALVADDLASAWAILIDARTQLEAVAELAVGEDDLALVGQQRTAIDDQMSRISKMQRVGSVQTIGLVPTPPDGVTSRLVVGDGRVYLLSNGIYQVDVASRSLLLLLRQGDIVDNVPVEVLRAAAWRENRLMVIDARRAYIFDPTTGGWTVEALGTFDSAGFTDVAAGSTFDFNLYLLARESGQILKFQAGLYENNPEDWTGGIAKDELKAAADMAVDGNVWVLLEDGKILNFFRSRLEATIVPEIVPPLERVSAIYTSPTSEYLYVLSATDGRIVRLTRTGDVVQQMTTGDTGSPIAGADDFAIDEASGIAYVLANETIYTLRMPAVQESSMPTGSPIRN